MNKFNIPVVLFTFKRSNTVERILKVLKAVGVSKLYLFSDYGRDDNEKALVEQTRREILDGLSVLGIKIDEEANDCRGVERLITTEDSSIPCYVIPTNEELMIARDTYALYQEKEKEKELIEKEII